VGNGGRDFRNNRCDVSYVLHVVLSLPRAIGKPNVCVNIAHFAVYVLNCFYLYFVSASVQVKHDASFIVIIKSYLVVMLMKHSSTVKSL